MVLAIFSLLTPRELSSFSRSPFGRGGRFCARCGLAGWGRRALIVEFSLLFLNFALECTQISLSAVEIAIGDGLDLFRHGAGLVYPALEDGLERRQSRTIFVDLRQ